jgi:hypothetical protein
LWYRWTAPSSGWLTLRPTTNLWPISFRVFIGQNVGGLADIIGGPMAIQLPMAANEDFRIQVDRVLGAGGPIDFSYKFAPAPPNDEFEQATILTNAPALLDGNTRTATTEHQPYYTDSRFADRDLWWRWTAPGSGFGVLSNNLSDVSNRIRVYTGTNRAARALLATNWTELEIAPALTFPASSGTVYSFRMSASYPSDLMNWTFHFAPSSAGLVSSEKATDPYVLEISTDLREWTPIATNSLPHDMGFRLRSRNMDRPQEFWRQRRVIKTGAD